MVSYSSIISIYVWTFITEEVKMGATPVKQEAAAMVAAQN